MFSGSLQSPAASAEDQDQPAYYLLLPPHRGGSTVDDKGVVGVEEH